MEQGNAINALLQSHTELQAAVRALLRQQERGNDFTRPPGAVLTKLGPDDDVTAYLELFERIAARERWPVADWGTILSGFLTGEAQQVCSELPLADGRDYRTLKTAILDAQGNSLPARAQKVTDWRFDPAQPARSQINALNRHVNRWLLGEGDIPMVDRVVMDRCIRGLPPKAKEYAANVSPRSLRQLVELVENYYISQNSDEDSDSEDGLVGPALPPGCERGEPSSDSEDYKFTVEHRPGKAIPHAGALSRRYEDEMTSLSSGSSESLRGRVCGVSLRSGRPTVSKRAPGVSAQTHTQQRPRMRLGEVIEGRYLPRYLLDQQDGAHLRS